MSVKVRRWADHRSLFVALTRPSSHHHFNMEAVDATERSYKGFDGTDPRLALLYTD